MERSNAIAQGLMLDPIPASTYRLQIRREFPFSEAEALASYFVSLGITHLYTSPIFEAPPESGHGYDVWDHNRIGSHLGGESEFAGFHSAIADAGLGIIVDFVPNHMGIQGVGNAWWMDLLKNGQKSEFASFFDIDWSYEGQGRVTLPVLGDFYGAVLARGEIKLLFEAGRFVVGYYESRFPLSDESVAALWKRVNELLPSSEQVGQTKNEVITSNGGGHPGKAVQRALEVIQSTCALDSSQNELHRILEMQAYRLAYWRFGTREINYRRFFEVSSLAGLRMEDPKVFDATHRLVRKLIREGRIQGIRIDHVDGLADPRAYLERLQSLAVESLESKADPASKPFYTVVEKILTLDERLPQSWPVHGTTGYEFASQVLGVLIDPEAENGLTRFYEDLTGQHASFSQVVYEKKKLILELSFPREVRSLSELLYQIAQNHLIYRDLSHDVLRTVVIEYIARLPVYRTYITPGEDVRPEDEAIVTSTIQSVKQSLPESHRPAGDFLQELLLLQWPGPKDPALAQVEQWLRKLQQFTGAATAKGVEDTSFYVYNRLVCLNEVGSFPERFSNSVESFHEQNRERLAHWPGCMLTTSTHDTKMSEDVRARIAVLSELESSWQASVRLWRDLNQKQRRSVGGKLAPDVNEEYLLYQILIGSLPFDFKSPEVRQDYVSRLQGYFQKATREAKVNSSWIDPRPEWEEAQSQFIAALLETKEGNVFLELFLPLAEQVAQCGAINALSQLVLKLTVPGVPDIYQGNEIWNFSLVDPDNRRPVDYQQRIALLNGLAGAPLRSLLENWKSGAIKLFVTQKLLHLRRAAPDLFAHGSYHPLAAQGEFRNHVIAFDRSLDGRRMLAIVPRLSAKVGFPPVGDRWKDTRIEFPASLAGQLSDVFTGSPLLVEENQISLSAALADFPAAVFSDV